MPERDGYAHGVPSWVDLGTSDVAGAKGFYGGLFGWEAEDQPTDLGVPYTMFSKAGKAVAGGAPIPPDVAERGMPPMWNSYVSVDDVDAAVAKAEAAGGSVAMPAMDVMTAGRMAFVMDPTGAAVGLWQAGDHKGAQLVNEEGALTWNELITEDPGAVMAFYADVFGWDTQIQEMPDGGEYTMFMVGDRPVAGMMPKPEQMAQMPNSWGIYFAVDDCEGCATKVAELGGRVLRGPFATGVGEMAVLQDPQGAVFSVVQLNQEARERA